jgi:predicted nucleic acid-binding protein
MNLIVDASIALKWFVAESDSPAAYRIRTEHDLAAPDLLLAECRNGLLNKVRRRDLTVLQAKAVEREIEAMELAILPTTAFLTRAFEIALEAGEPIYDCLYLAAAFATDRVLITADSAFVSAVAKSSFGLSRIKLLSELSGV